ncbi:MAG TPA: BMP family ABC transporter substrate-binding protein [Gaiellaceae bacterium]|nr:BMP family ABC transporter substrate-binding protein [Gaiellaceae bacterium]
MNGKRRWSWLALMVMLAAAIAVAAAGCGGGDGETTGGAGTGAATETSGGEPVTVGLVTDIGGLNDRGFNALANQGLEDARAQLGVEGDVLESKSDADYIPNLSEFGQKGANLIVSVGFLMTDATAQAAEAFPDSNFAIVDSAFDPAIPNAQGLLFKEQEAGCLVGVVGALTSKTGTITWVGGQKIPPVDRFIAGYEFCAKDANPDIKVSGSYSDDFVDQAKCKEIALDQISKGSDVVFQVAGGCGLGALDAAKQEGVWGIGVDADQSFLGPHILTSAVKRVNVAVFKTIQSVQDGSFTGGGVTTFGLAEDGVGLGTVSDKVTQDVLDTAEEYKQKILNGEIQIPDTVS